MKNGFKNHVLDVFLRLKTERFSNALPEKIPVLDRKNTLIAFLRPLTKKTIRNKKEVALLSKWRKENSFAFPSQFKVTKIGTANWLENQLIGNPARILFFIEAVGENPKLIGHMGLYSFDFENHSCEVDNVVRGEKNILKGAMTNSLNTLINWTLDTLKAKKIYLRVFADNTHAVDFYRRCGFTTVDSIPLKKTVKPNMIVWEEDRKESLPEKIFLKMLYG